VVDKTLTPSARRRPAWYTALRGEAVPQALADDKLTLCCRLNSTAPAMRSSRRCHNWRNDSVTLVLYGDVR